MVFARKLTHSCGRTKVNTVYSVGYSLAVLENRDFRSRREFVSKTKFIAKKKKDYDLKIKHENKITPPRRSNDVIFGQKMSLRESGNFGTFLPEKYGKCGFEEKMSCAEKKKEKISLCKIFG